MHFFADRCPPCTMSMSPSAMFPLGPAVVFTPQDFTGRASWRTRSAAQSSSARGSSNKLLRHSAAPCRLYTWACCVRCVPPRMDDMYEDPRHDHVYTLVSAPRLDDYTFTRTHYTFTRCAYARTALQSPPLRPASRFPYPTTPLIPCAALHHLHLRRAARPCARHASVIGSIHHARPNRASVRGGR